MEDDVFDLYEDLEDFDYKVKYEEAENKINDLKRKLDEANKKITLLEDQKSELQSKIDNLERSFQSLLLTARSEIKRKDAQIAEARKQKDDIVFRRHKNPQFNKHKENPFRTNDKVSEKTDPPEIVTTNISNEIIVNKFNDENKNIVNPIMKTNQSNEDQLKGEKNSGKTTPAEAVSIKYANEKNINQCSTSSGEPSSTKIECKHEPVLHLTEKTSLDRRDDSRSREEFNRNHEANAQKTDSAKVQKEEVSKTELEDKKGDSRGRKSDHGKFDSRRLSPSPTRRNDLERGDSKVSKEQKPDLETRDSKISKRQNNDISRRDSKDSKERKNDSGKRDPKDSKDRKDEERKRTYRDAVDHRGRNAYNPDRELSDHNRRHDRARGYDDRVRGQRDRDKVERNIDRSINDRDRTKTDRNTTNKDRGKAINDRDKVSDRDKGSSDRGKVFNERDREFSDRDRIRDRQHDRYRDQRNKDIENEYYKSDRGRDRDKEKNIFKANESRHKYDRGKIEIKSNEATRYDGHKFNKRDEERQSSSDRPRRLLHENNKIEKDTLKEFSNRRSNTELDRRKNDHVQNELKGEKQKSIDIGRKRAREDEHAKEDKKYEKPSPSKKRKRTEKEKDQVEVKTDIENEFIEPEVIDSFSEDHLEALKKQLEMQLSGEFSNEAKFSSDEEGLLKDEEDLLKETELPFEPTQNPNLNSEIQTELILESTESSNRDSQPKVAKSHSPTKKSPEKVLDIQNNTNESDYTQVDMEIEPPRVVQVDIKGENISSLSNYNRKSQEFIENQIPLCKKKKAMSILNNPVQHLDENKCKTKEFTTNAQAERKNDKDGEHESIASTETKVNHKSIEKEDSSNTLQSPSKQNCKTNKKEIMPSETKVAMKRTNTRNRKEQSPQKKSNRRTEIKERIPDNTGITKVSEAMGNNSSINNNNGNTKSLHASRESIIHENKDDVGCKNIRQKSPPNIKKHSKSSEEVISIKSDNDENKNKDKAIIQTPSASSLSFSAIKKGTPFENKTLVSSSNQTKEVQKTEDSDKCMQSSNLSNLDTSIDSSSISNANRFQSSLESVKHSDENEEIFETPIKVPRYIKNQRSQLNCEIRKDVIGITIKVNSEPSEDSLDREDLSMNSMKRKHVNDIPGGSTKRSKNSETNRLSEGNCKNEKDLNQIKIDALSTKQLDALEKQLAFEVYGENIYENATKEIAIEQKERSQNHLSTDSIFGSPEENIPQRRKSGIYTNKTSKAKSDSDKLSQKTQQEVKLEKVIDNQMCISPIGNAATNSNEFSKIMSHSSNMVLKNESETTTPHSDSFLSLNEIKVENDQIKTEMNENPEVEILGTIEILPSRTSYLPNTPKVSKQSNQTTKGRQRSTTKKNTNTIHPSNSLENISSNAQAHNINSSSPVDPKLYAKDKPEPKVKRESKQQPRLTNKVKPATSLNLSSLKESNRIILETKKGMWLKCDCVASEFSEEKVPDQASCEVAAALPTSFGTPPFSEEVPRQEDVIVTIGKPLDESKSKQRKTKTTDAQLTAKTTLRTEVPDQASCEVAAALPTSVGTAPFSEEVPKKEDVIATIGKPLDESKGKQRKTKITDAQLTAKTTQKTKSNVKMVGHMIEGFEREPSPLESKLDTSRGLKHELFKEALGMTSSTPYKSDVSEASKVSESSSNESFTETKDKKTVDETKNVKRESISKVKNQDDNCDMKVCNEKPSGSESKVLIDLEDKKEHKILSQEADKCPTNNSELDSQDSVSSKIEILDVQIIQGCALNTFADEVKKPSQESDKKVDTLSESAICESSKKSNDKTALNQPNSQESIIIKNRNKSSEAKESKPATKLAIERSKSKKAVSKLDGPTKKITPILNDISSNALDPTENINSLNSLKAEKSSTDSGKDNQHSKDCDIKNAIVDSVPIESKSPVAEIVKQRVSVEPSISGPTNSIPSTKSVAQSEETPKSAEKSPNNSILNRSHEKRNISTTSSNYVIEQLDNNVVNVFITRKKVKKKKKV